MKPIDKYNEIDDSLNDILKLMKPINKKQGFMYIKDNINVLNVISNTSIEIDNINNFQELLRIQNMLINENIKLVGIDISRTIIEYRSSLKTQLKAAKIIKNKYNDIFNDISEEDIVDIFSKGFKKYNNKRLKSKAELDEVYVYKKYILKNIDNDCIIKDIIKIWMENSVNLILNSKKIRNIVEELKKRNLIVVTISDMLGDMSKYALKYFDIYHIFDGHFCSNDFKYRKSNKKNSLYKQVAKYFKLNPKNCLMIGNDIIDDVKCSINNGWESIYTSYGNDIISKNSIITLNRLDDLYDYLSENKITKLPVLKDNMHLYRNIATRENDENEYIKNAYYVRQKVKYISNRDLREYIYKTYLIRKCGKTTRLGNNVEIRNPFNIIIGDNCQINDNLTILNENFVFIGNNVMIANNVFISTYKHDWKRGMLQDNIEPWKKGDTKTNCVSIEDNCWIGPNCSFESDVYLGHHSVVCANSLVKSGIYPPYSLIGGSPAKIIKNIEEDLILEGKIK